jgi:hypothetical protein
VSRSSTCDVGSTGPHYHNGSNTPSSVLIHLCPWS